MADVGVWGWMLNLVTALLVAWCAAWFYSRRERDRLREVWRQERVRTALDSLKECVDRVAQGLTVATMLRKIESEERGMVEAHLEGYLDGLRGAASLRVMAKAIGDQELAEASEGLDGAAEGALKGDREALMEGIEHCAVMVRRCDELLEEAVATKGKR